MSAITAFTELQDRAGREVAQSIAAFVEEVRGQDLSQLATKADIHDLEQKIMAQNGILEQKIMAQGGSLEQKILVQSNTIDQKLHDMENRLNIRMQWTAFFQILTTVGALIALAKLL